MAECLLNWEWLAEFVFHRIDKLDLPLARYAGTGEQVRQDRCGKGVVASQITSLVLDEFPFLVVLNIHADVLIEEVSDAHVIGSGEKGRVGLIERLAFGFIYR